MSSGPKYVGAYPLGDPRYLMSTGRANVATGELMTKYLGKTTAELERYMAEYRRSGSAATGARAASATLAGLSRKVFSAYIRYALAQDLHGAASASAPRRAEEFSQVQVEEEEQGFFGVKRTTRIIRGGLSVVQEREINAIVRDNVVVAAEYGLTEGGSNLGPDIDEEKAKAKIVADGGENVASFTGGRRGTTRKGTKGAKGTKGSKTRKTKAKKTKSKKSKRTRRD